MCAPAQQAGVRTSISCVVRRVVPSDAGVKRRRLSRITAWRGMRESVSGVSCVLSTGGESVSFWRLHASGRKGKLNVQ